MGTYARVGTKYEIGLISLGESLLKETFREAAIWFVKSTPDIEVEQSLMFIRGSGVETIISTFGLSYSAKKLRETFDRCINHS